MRVLNVEDDIQSIINDNRIVILEYGSSSCAPCSAIKAKVDSYIKGKDIVAYYIPIEDYRELSANMGVFSSPTLRVYVDGKLTIDRSGYFGVEDIFLSINRYIDILN